MLTLKTQLDQFNNCLAEWERLEKQLFLIEHGGHIIQATKELKGDSDVHLGYFDYSAFFYYELRMIFFAKKFTDCSKIILESPCVINICRSAIGDTWFSLDSDILSYYFDAFMMAAATFTEKELYERFQIKELYKSLLIDEKRGYSIESRLKVIRNRTTHADREASFDNGVHKLIDTKSNGLAKYDGKVLKIQNSLIDIKDNPELYKVWKRGAGPEFIQEAIDAGAPLNAAGYDLFELFLSVSQDLFYFFDRTNQAMADLRGLAPENTGTWMYGSKEKYIRYQDVFCKKKMVRL